MTQTQQKSHISTYQNAETTKAKSVSGAKTEQKKTESSLVQALFWLLSSALSLKDETKRHRTNPRQKRVEVIRFACNSLE
jgi:hypothetical protein